MPTACINQSNCRVRLNCDRLEVTRSNPETGNEEILREIPIRDLDRLVISESVHFTPAAMAEVLRSGIPIQVFSWNGQFLGNFLPAQNSHGLARLRQYQRTLDLEFGLQIGTRIVAAKIYNQRRVLQRINAGRTADSTSDDAHGHETNNQPEPSLAHTLQYMDQLAQALKSCRSIDEVRGYEGAATARYSKHGLVFCH